MINKLSRIALGIYILINLNSCSSYIKNISNKEYSFLPQSIGYTKFEYLSSIKYHRGPGSSVDATKFSILLPEKVKSYMVSGSTHFILLDKNEIVCIQTDDFNSQTKRDSLLNSPRQNLVEGIVTEVIFPRFKDHYPKSVFKYNNTREHAIFYKDNATILLFNIRKSNIDHYIDLLKAFKTINH